MAIMGGDEELWRENAKLRRQLASRDGQSYSGETAPPSHAERENVQLRRELAESDGRQSYSQQNYAHNGREQQGPGYEEGFALGYDEASYRRGVRRRRDKRPGIVRTVLHGDDARTGQGNDLHSALHGRDSGYRDGQGAVNSGRARNGGLVGLLTGAVSELSTTFTQPNTQLGQNQRSRDPFESSMRPSDAPLPGQSAQYSGQVHDADAEEMYYMNSWHTPFIPD